MTVIVPLRYFISIFIVGYFVLGIFIVRHFILGIARIGYFVLSESVIDIVSIRYHKKWSSKFMIIRPIQIMLIFLASTTLIVFVMITLILFGVLRIFDPARVRI